jgi:hypothetical protein
MATLQKVNGADFISGAIGLVPPVPRALAGIFVLGGSLEQSRRNFAPGAAAPGQIVGAPGVFANYLSLKGNTNYLNTLVAETDSATWIVVARAPLIATGNRPALVGNYVSTIAGAMAYIDGPTTAPAGTLRVNVAYQANSNATAVDPDVTAWGYYELSIVAGAPTILRERTRNATVTTPTPTGTRTKNTAMPVRVGSAGHGTYSGDSDIALAILHSDVLTPTEQDANYTWAKAVALKRLGVAI